MEPAVETKLFPVMKHRNDPIKEPERWGYIDQHGKIGNTGMWTGSARCKSSRTSTWRESSTRAWRAWDATRPRDHELRLELHCRERTENVLRLHFFNFKGEGLLPSTTTGGVHSRVFR